VVPVAEAADVDGTAVLLVADVAEAAQASAALDALGSGPRSPAVLGLIYATASGEIDLSRPDLPLLDTVELAPWSPAAVRIWLRATLRGEPTRTLVNWLATRSRGLPARAERELELLRGRDGLVATVDGGWSVAPRLLERPRRRSRLPAPMTALVGRHQEHERVVGMLRRGRLVTLLGPGGIGKTRLSLSVAGALAPDYEDGAVFVALADTSDTEQMVAAVAHALGVAEVSGEPLLETVIEYLGDAALLLVLDNFEQVLDASGVVSALLSASTGVAVLATSRERLSVYGEQVYQVPPLPLPDLDRLPATPDGGGPGAGRVPRDRALRAARPGGRRRPPADPADPSGDRAAVPPARRAPAGHRAGCGAQRPVAPRRPARAPHPPPGRARRRRP
jgi:energy-coupling factor transporter ATP-binding protein EcfA2